MNYMNPFAQPFLPNIQPPQQSAGQYGIVQSKDEALRFQLPFGQSIILFNQNDDVFYKKSVDLSGHVVLTECRYQEVQPAQPPKYVTADEIGDLVQKRVDAALAPIVQALNAKAEQQKETTGKRGVKNEPSE